MRTLTILPGTRAWKIILDGKEVGCFRTLALARQRARQRAQLLEQVGAPCILEIQNRRGTVHVIKVYRASPTRERRPNVHLFSDDAA
jgi:hypothetical protein